MLANCLHGSRKVCGAVPKKQAWRGKVPVSGNKLLPSSASFTDHEQPKKADSSTDNPPEIPRPRADLSIQGPYCGLLYFHKCTGNLGFPQLPKWAKSRDSLRGGECAMFREVGSERPKGRPFPLETTSHTLGSSSSPFSYCLLLTLATLLRDALSGLPEVLNTYHLLPISVCDQF